jgi:hypothetical protein
MRIALSAGPDRRPSDGSFVRGLREDCRGKTDGAEELDDTRGSWSWSRTFWNAHQKM